MTVQTAYSKYTDRAALGLLYDVNPMDIASFAAEEKVGFGRVVGRGTDPARQCTEGEGSEVLGISCRTTKEGAYHDSNPDVSLVYDDEETVGVVRQGALWADYQNGDASPVAGDPVYVITTVGANLGKVTAVDTGTLLANATFESVSHGNDNITDSRFAIVRLGV